ncbi:unnamed protein product [Polarella glacialis]|uniref:Amine oxidase domain-containing protein n=1 Tax=Polarella glacialis TaxID=89957 RepID=A0A813DY30_POLGL|nr:unnamed protein product [Polarella glacialis]
MQGCLVITCGLFLLAEGGIGSSTAHDCELDVLVLGAGISGVKAGATLYEGGVRNFAVLEQSQRIGGRMWNVQWHGQSIELGANWIEGIPQKEDPIWSIAQEIGLQGNYTCQEGSDEEPLLYNSAGKLGTNESLALHQRFAAAVSAAFAVSCQRHRAGLGDVSLREALSSVGWPAIKNQTPLERTLEFFVVDWDFQYPPDNVSLFNYFDVGKGTYEETCAGVKLKSRRAHRAVRMGMLDSFAWEPPRFFVTDPRGYAAVAQHVAKPFLQDATNLGTSRTSQGKCPESRMLFNKTVVTIDYGDANNDRGVRVETSDGSVYWAKHCILTFSAGVINAAVESGTLFRPALPEWKAGAFARIQNGVYTKIFLRFETQFWDDADYILFADSSRRGYYAVWQDMESHHKFFPKGSNILLVTVVHEDSKRIEVQPTAQTLEEVHAVLSNMYGPHIPRPLDVVVPKWHSDPSFRGSWSNIAVGTTVSDFRLLQKALGGLIFAGEATDQDFNGFVLGGYHSGERAAKHVLEALEKGSDALVSEPSSLSPGMPAYLRSACLSHFPWSFCCSLPFFF